MPKIARIIFSAILLCLPNLSGANPPTTGVTGEIRIGVLANRGQTEALKRWAPTASYLSAHIPGYRFTMVPLNLAGIRDATRDNHIQFTLTNPGNYAELETRYGISRIATLQTTEGNQVSVRYGAVIITRADNQAIQTLEDLRGKSFMAVSKDAFSGFQMAWLELVEHGINPFNDFSKLRFAGFPQDKIVRAVQSGQVDAGTVSAETFASMIESGEVKARDFRILNLQSNNSPVPVSTRLYPEWAFATLKNTPRDLATRVAVALLSMSAQDPAAVSAHSAGWTIPLDYSPVTALMRSLKIGPFESLHETSFLALMAEYKYWLVATALMLISLVALNGYISRTNQRLREEISRREASQKALARYRDTLEEQVMERTRDLRQTNRGLKKSRVALRKLLEITSSPELDNQQRLQQLLEAGRKYFALDMAVLTNIEGEKQKICISSSIPELTSDIDCPINKPQVAHLITHPGVVIDIPDNMEPATDVKSTNPAWRSYLGIGVMLEGRIHYTLEFTGKEARKSYLSQWDHELLKVMAQWITDELERQMALEAQHRHESEFARVSRMSTIGEMATSLAHELNQPLTGTINYSNGCLRMLREAQPDISKLTQGLEHAVEGATMAANIVRHIRQFVQKDGEGYHELDLNEAVQNAITLVSHEIQRHHVRVSLKLDEDLPLVNGNLIQLEQVVLNFVLNGIDAMGQTQKQKRQLIIRTEAIEGDKVRLGISDNGKGIPEDCLPKIFDAFFSTKVDGMGIGLSISRSIIESHHGKIGARALEQGGAEFYFELPAIMET